VQNFFFIIVLEFCKGRKVADILLILCCDLLYCCTSRGKEECGRHFESKDKYEVRAKSFRPGTLRKIRHRVVTGL